MNTEQRLHMAQGGEFTNSSRANSARAITISSGPSGVGRSSLSINLAVELARLNKEVCLLDTDANLANLNILSCLAPLYSLHDVLSGDKLLEDVMLNGPAGISIIPAASSVVDWANYDERQQQQMVNIVRQLEASFDYILIDTGSGIHDTQLEFIAAVPETVMTITTEPTTLKHAFNLLQQLSGRGFNRTLRLVVNRASSLGVAEFTMQWFSSMVKLFLGIDISSTACVLEDENVPRSIAQQLPYVLLYPTSPATRGIHNLANHLIEANRQQALKLSEYLVQNKMFEQGHGATVKAMLDHEVVPIIRSRVEPEVDDKLEANRAEEADATVEIPVVSTQQEPQAGFFSAPVAKLMDKASPAEWYDAEVDAAEAVAAEGADASVETPVADTRIEPQADFQAARVTEADRQMEEQPQRPRPADAELKTAAKSSQSIDYLTAIQFASQLNEQQSNNNR